VGVGVSLGNASDKKARSSGRSSTKDEVRSTTAVSWRWLWTDLEVPSPCAPRELEAGTAAAAKIAAGLEWLLPGSIIKGMNLPASLSSRRIRFAPGACRSGSCAAVLREE
jgi:hypothetical protein